MFLLLFALAAKEPNRDRLVVGGRIRPRETHRSTLIIFIMDTFVTSELCIQNEQILILLLRPGVTGHGEALAKQYPMIHSERSIWLICGGV